MTGINESIVKFLEESEVPMTLDSIAYGVGALEVTTRRGLDELIAGGVVQLMFPQNEGSAKRAYYSLVQEKVLDAEKKDDCNKYIVKNKEVDQNIVNVKDKYTDLEEKIKRIDNNVNGIYINIISIMSIFVSIFSLITVNANIVFDLSKDNACNVVWGIIWMNIFVVICIIVLLIVVNMIIIKPMRSDSKRRKTS